MYERPFISLSIPAGFLALALAAVAAGWWWLGKPVAMPEASPAQGEKLYCVSYAPFRGEQSPLSAGTHIPATQIEEDLARLKAVTGCIRSYSTEHGLDQIPEIARRHGLKLLQGLWLSSDPLKNETRIAEAIDLAKSYPDVISAVVVGNEVLLRGEMAAPELAAIIRRVKAEVPMPVTYADVWEFWLRHREVAAAVDFITIHILPYWEDFPIPATQAAAHVDAIYREMATAFPGREILIGETGWPSAGRMREAALPSLSNQARAIQETLAMARRDGFRVNVIEAFDQPWKRRLEGTVGGFWGLHDAATREAKFALGVPVSDYPLWREHAAGGLLLAFLVFGAAGLARRGRKEPVPAMLWLAVAVNAALAGVFVGLAVEKALVESLGFGGWLRSLALVTLALVVPFAASAGLMRGVAAASFAETLGGEASACRLPVLLGWLLAAVTVMALALALGLVFDPRYRDFPYAPLTAAILPFMVLSLAAARRNGARGVSEIFAGATLALSAIYILFNETFANWQSLWLCALLAILALILFRARHGAAPG
jgi:exo-beta-1,3-glucanase (GH17 family)